MEPFGHPLLRDNGYFSRALRAGDILTVGQHWYDVMMAESKGAL
jgi:hypothetical protein